MVLQLPRKFLLIFVQIMILFLLFNSVNAAVQDISASVVVGAPVMTLPPVVNLVSPSPGERIDTFTLIVWTATDPDSDDSSLDVNLYYDKDGVFGNADDLSIIKGTVNDGVFNWATSLISDGHYFIHVRACDPENNCALDSIDSYFLIEHPNAAGGLLLAPPIPPKAIPQLYTTTQDTSFIVLEPGVPYELPIVLINKESQSIDITKLDVEGELSNYTLFDSIPKEIPGNRTITLKAKITVPTFVSGEVKGSIIVNGKVFDVVAKIGKRDLVSKADELVGTSDNQVAGATVVIVGSLSTIWLLGRLFSRAGVGF